MPSETDPFAGRPPLHSVDALPLTDTPQGLEPELPISIVELQLCW
jgi:hypothetical protein